jgi:hypothetical protein
MDELSQRELVKEVQQYVALKDQITQLTARQNEVKKRLQKLVVEQGEETDKGHKALPVNDPTTGVVEIVNQRRVSKSLDEQAATTLLSDKDLIESCLEFVPVINEEAVMAAFYSGKLTEEDIDAMFPSQVTWAFTLNKG